MSQPGEDPYSDTHLESPQYRERLRRKLDCLIAVLELACAKVRRNMEAPGGHKERFERIHKNLADTLATCERARAALERRERLPADLDRRLAALADEEDARTQKARSAAPRSDFRSAAERERFLGRSPIANAEIRECDFDALARALQKG
jgi:hypothetical protein